jgi:hypothetical protein
MGSHDDWAGKWCSQRPAGAWLVEWQHFNCIPAACATCMPKVGGGIVVRNLGINFSGLPGADLGAGTSPAPRTEHNPSIMC